MYRTFLLLLTMTVCAGMSAQMNTESFETWDGQTTDWLPDGWTELHTDEWIPAQKNGEWTWHVIDPSKSSSLPKATDGKYYAAIGYARDDNKVDHFQDEWLITPAYKLSQYGGTLNYDVAYSPLFLFLLDNDHVDFNEMDFKIRESSADLQVLVRIMDENGEWPDLWEFESSLFDDWQGQVFSSLYNAFFSTTFHNSGTVFFTEDRFKGATIQVAFRYAGDRGGIMGLDNVKFNYATRVETGIQSTTAVRPQTVATYDLAGRVCKNLPAAGLFIQNGKKVLR